MRAAIAVLSITSAASAIPFLDMPVGLTPEQRLAHSRAWGDAVLHDQARSDPNLARSLARARELNGGRMLPPGSSSSTNARAASLLGGVATTTVAGTDAYTTSISFPIGTTIAGPFEAGFDSTIDILLGWLGCSPASQGYLVGGTDTQTALEAVSINCTGNARGLPSVSAGVYKSLMWSAGAHSPPTSTGCTSPPGGLSGYTACVNPSYHYHQNFSNLYTMTATGHSTKVGVTAPTDSSITARNIYGRFESTGVLPALDACNGHFGFTPDSPSTSVYHHHVTNEAPFSVGCYGPAADGGLVSLQACRSYYSTCGDGTISITTTKGTIAYDTYCPCYDNTTGLNVPYTCPAGYYNSNYRSSVSACLICAAGTYSSAGATSCTSCASGTTSLAGASTCVTNSTVTGTFVLSALPTSSFSGSTLTTAAVTSLTAALSTAIMSASSTSAVTVTITSVTETSSGTSLYTSSRRLAYGALTIAYSVTGASTAIAAVSSVSTSALQTAITTSVTSISGYSAISVTVSSSPSSSTSSSSTSSTTSSSTTNAIIGGVVGGGGGVLFIAIAYYLFCCRKTVEKKPVTTESPARAAAQGATVRNSPDFGPFHAIDFRFGICSDFPKRTPPPPAHGKAT